MGVAGYSEMAHMLGLYDVAEKYAGIAKKMAVKWEEMANEGNHYRLAFDRENTWSQKYNMIWDKMWNLNLFPNNVIDKDYVDCSYVSRPRYFRTVHKSSL